MQIKFLPKELLDWLYPNQERRQEIDVLPDLLLNAEAFLQERISASSILIPPSWRGRTLYLLPIGVRSAGGSELAKLILNCRQDIPPEQANNLLRPVLFLLSENTMHDWDAHRAVKNKQFYLQTACSYGIGRVVPYSELTEFLSQLLDSLLEEIRRAPEAAPWDLTLFPAVHSWSGSDLGPHVDRVYNTFWGGLDSLFRLQHDPKKQAEAFRDFGIEISAEPTAALSLEQRVEFLRLLAVAYHVGRYRRAQFHAGLRLPKFGAKIGSTRLLKDLREELIEEFRRRTLSEGGSREELASEQDPTTTYSRLRIYYLLRDSARTLASSATLWVDSEESPGRSPQAQTAPRRILLIDDNYRSDVNWRLSVIRDRLWKGRAEVYIARPGVWVEFANWFETNWGNQVRTWQPTDEHLTVEPMPAFPSAGQDHNAATAPLRLDEYDVILLDAEVEGRDRGPELVFWLDTLFQHQREARQGQREDHGPSHLKEKTPRLIVLTDARPTESLQQCLNLGVETYISKDRIFDLPFAIMQVVEPFGVRKDLGDAQDFRAVHQLPLRSLSAIRSKAPCRVVSGNPRHYLDRRWIKKLPKADLHYHIGTSITMESISAMAMNTMGYLLGRNASPPDGFLDAAIRRVCSLVYHTLRRAENRKDQHEKKGKKGLDLAEAMWEEVCEKNPKLLKRYPTPPANVYDIVIAEVLHRGDNPIEQFEIASVLVAAIAYWDERLKAPGLPSQPAASSWCDRWGWLGELGHPGDARAAFSQRFQSVLEDALAGWTGIYAEDHVKETFQRGTAAFLDWKAVSQQVLARSNAAWQELDRQFAQLGPPVENLDRLAGNTHRTTPLLLDFVVAPEDGSRSLPIYLRGAGLLGADHLQFPENILLAALDITRQNVEDNVWYSELRCATTGYCQAGLRAVNATDLLCRSFDLAAAHWAEVFNNRWVLVNVLLGAKRHKESEIPQVVSLMMGYLQRARSLSERETFVGAPSWWSPSNVIGFDLSGNESQRELPVERLHNMMSQLLANCAQITIHAGEAASAENIWDAIYRLGARRIGHGLRLREHSQLMDHAMRLGICLELCPTSNALTNDFARRSTPGGHNPKDRWHYPLRTYMDQNMQVCLNTDNRFLHRVNALTDEYLEAARMVGGLSRLEILRLVRAGFSSAFLAHEQKSRLMKQVNEVVYRLLSEHDEEVYGPNGS